MFDDDPVQEHPHPDMPPHQIGGYWVPLTGQADGGVPGHFRLDFHLAQPLHLGERCPPTHPIIPRRWQVAETTVRPLLIVPAHSRRPATVQLVQIGHLVRHLQTKSRTTNWMNFSTFPLVRGL